MKSVASLRLAGIGKKRPPAESDAHTGEVLRMIHGEAPFLEGQPVGRAAPLIGDESSA